MYTVLPGDYCTGYVPAVSCGLKNFQVYTEYMGHTIAMSLFNHAVVT